jgi:hypothetical protein
LIVGEVPAVLDGIGAAFDNVRRCLTAVNVYGDLFSRVVRFVNRGLDVI